MRAGATWVLFACSLVEQSSRSVVVEWMRGRCQRFHRTSCCSWEVRGKRKFRAWVENEQMKQHCCPRRVFPAWSALTVRALSAILWVRSTWNSSPHCYSPRWVCIGVRVSLGVHIYLYMYIYVYILVTILELQSLSPKRYWQMEAPAVSAEQCGCQHDMCKKHKGAVVFFIWANNSLLTINWKKCLGTLLSLLAQPGAGFKCWGNRSHVLSGSA